MNKKYKISLATILLLCLGFLTHKVFFQKGEEIILMGNVEVQDVNVSFRGSGRIFEVNFDEGMKVQKGAILATLDKDILTANLKSAEAKLNESNIILKNSEKDYNRNKKLFIQKNISEKAFDDITVKYQTACALRDLAKASFDLAKIQLEDETLKSPVDGTILTRNIEPGEMIGSGVVVFSIMPNKKTRIKTFANEEVLSRLKYNEEVLVSIDSLPNKKFKGKIGFISSEAEFTPKNIETKELRTSLMYRIRIILDEDTDELKQGMPVTVFVCGK